MKENRSFALLIVWAMFMISLMVNVWQCSCAEKDIENDTTRVTVVDTVVYHAPEPKEEKRVGSVIDKLKIVDDRKDDRKISVAEEVETLIAADSSEISRTLSAYFQSFPTHSKLERVDTDSVYVAIPITQKVYADNTYRAVVSGYGVCLDTMFVYPRTEIVTIRQKPKRWSIGVQAGYGVMFQGKMVGAPYVGVGISYRLFDI